MPRYSLKTIGVVAIVLLCIALGQVWQIHNLKSINHAAKIDYDLMDLAYGRLEKRVTALESAESLVTTVDLFDGEQPEAAH